MKRTTITQVAKEAGVTIGTVSHVINGTAPISAETTERVRRAIKALNYIPNATAKSLRSKKNYTIGLMLPNLNNSFHSKVASAFIDKAYIEGYSVQIHGYEYSLERERRELERLERNNIGTVIIFNGYGDEREIKNFLQKGIPVILADRSSTIAQVPHIKFDNHKIMLDIVSALQKKGYQRIGFFSEPIQLTNLKERFQGYQEALKKCGLSFNPKDVFVRDDLCLDNLKNGYRYMRDILSINEKEMLPDAWIASSDLLAIGMIRAMHECGYQIPADFGVVGFDNTEISGYVNPRLTTVEQNQILLGEKLMEMVKQINCDKKDVENISLEQSLVIRESC